ncbi:hypothetical protein ACWEKM_05660 [Streptomyces sp. NPDC004752]
MANQPVDEHGIRERILAVVEQIIGHAPEPGIKHLNDLDSLQVLELLVSLEEEFDIDSDRIMETSSDWWKSVDDLVTSIRALTDRAPAEGTQKG